MKGSFQNQEEIKALWLRYTRRIYSPRPALRGILKKGFNAEENRKPDGNMDLDKQMRGSRQTNEGC